MTDDHLSLTYPMTFTGRRDIDADAMAFLTRGVFRYFDGMPFGLKGHVTRPDVSTDALRAYLTERWTDDEVNDYFTERARRQAEFEREKAERERYEKTLRYRLSVVRDEARFRVVRAWEILRHGEEDDDDDY